MINELNDSLDNLFAGDVASAPRMISPRAPATFVENRVFVEGCGDCRGTGWWRPGYRCFKCKGAGKRTFKSSPEARAAERDRAAQKKVNKALALAEEIAAWKVDNAKVWAWMQNNAASFDFARSMVEALDKFGSLTDGQMAACVKCVNREDERKARQAAERAEREATAPTVNVNKLEQAFAKAKEAAARPGMQGIFMKPIKFQSGDVTVKVQPGSENSQWEGMLFLKNGDGKKLGFIKAGKFIRNYLCEDVEATAVVDCINDPEKAMVAYGKAFSSCGICGRGLLNDGSIERGIGPICAAKFGW